MVLIDWIASFGAWAWIIAGLVLLALELVVPGGVLVWMGIAGIITGLAAMVQPLSWPLQWGLFGVLSVVAIITWLRFSGSRPQITDRPHLNRRAETLVGREAVLVEPIAGGFGRVPLNDTVWRVAGPDLDAGTRVRVIGATGAVLSVEPVVQGERPVGTGGAS
ncbi:membrane protein [Devosia pacifica]|uniref:Membrane protein n=1 Tax=Devosia pacifica TaxID=1335967 RepID=A0A918S8X2_9HYPH|nr:NfeD family protein [Devosia pacifica]GHA26928.1 membrane protein [Devosia pacifica]